MSTATTAKENLLKEELKNLKLERIANEQALARARKAKKKANTQAEIEKRRKEKERIKEINRVEHETEREKRRKEKERMKEYNRAQQLLQQKKAAEKRKKKAERHRQIELEIRTKKAEKEAAREARREELLIEQQNASRIAIERLKREVLVTFDFKATVPHLQEIMKKYGEIEHSRLSPIGLHIRYKTQAAAKKSQEKKTLVTKLPSHVSPAEIKHHAVYFDAPEEMGVIDEDVLSQVASAMRAYGNVVNIKKKARYIVIFFDNEQSAQSLASSEGNSVTIEFEGHTVALIAGIPPTQRKRRNKEREAKKALNRAKKNGLPPSKTMRMKH